MADTPGEGCGIFPLIFGGWAKPACDWHDDSYITGSWHQKNMRRQDVDKHFLRLLLVLSKRGRLQGAKHVASYTMYGIVRVIGAPWWEGRR